MLYVTTRNNQETYTVFRALSENRSPDGGFFLPLRFPAFTPEQVDALAKKSFNQCAADILNMLLGTQLTAYDLDFSVGRSTARLVSLPHRIWLGETWHNLEGCYRRMEENLFHKVAPDVDSQPTDWFRIALRIGVLFGYFGKLMRKGAASIQDHIDVAVLSGDFSAPAAAYYARKMGLPIANIILCCNDNNNPWELLHHGQMRTGSVAVSTGTPEGDYVVPTDLERFIHACGGSREAERFAQNVLEGRMYVPPETVLDHMRSGMYASVVGEDRVRSAVPNVFKTHEVLLDAYTALVYSGLLDYRAGAGESRHALVLSEKSPDSDPKFLAEVMGLSPEEAQKLLHQ